MLAVPRDSPLTRCWVRYRADFIIVFVNLKGYYGMSKRRGEEGGREGRWRKKSIEDAGDENRDVHL